MQGFWEFNETPLPSVGVAVSSQSVNNAASYLGAGIAGPLDDFDGLDVVAEITGNTGGVLNVFMQTSPDNGLNWFDAISFPTVAAGASQLAFRAQLSISQASATPTIVGVNNAPSLTPNTTVSGAWGDRMRVAMRSGAGTSAAGSVVVRLIGQRPRTSGPG
jgi:hypothetical protein